VATDVAGIGEVIRDGETGFLVPSRDPDALAQAILRMTGNRQAAVEMADRGRELVMDMFDPEKCHREMLELFEKYTPERYT